MTGFMTVIIGMSGNKLRTPEVTFTSLVPTTITFSWPSVLHATSYEYYTSASGSASSPSTLTGDATSKVITVAAGNVPLTFYVRAVGPVIYEKSEYGSIVGLSTKGTLPTPTSLSGASTTTTRVTFTWAAGTPAPFDANWTYSYYTVINVTTSATVDGYASTSVAIDVPNIGDTAAIYVSAKGTNYITSGTTNTSRAAYGYLTAPTITTQAISTTVVRFSWTNPANVLSYQYYTSESGSTSSPIGPITLVSGTTSIDITVANAGNVTINVQSIGSPYAPSNTWGTLYGTAYLGYSTVTGISGLPVQGSTTQVSFTWTGANTNSYSYYTSVSGSAGSPTSTITDSNKPLTVASSGANTQVTLYLKSLGNASYMPATSYSSGVGTSYAGTASISNLSATSLTTTTVRVSWNTISNVASFSYHTNLATSPITLANTTTSQDVSTSGIGGSVRFYISATGATNYMNMAETYVDGSSYGYWATPSLTYASTSTTTFTVSWSAASGATYQYSTPTVAKTNTTPSNSSQSITVSSAGGNATVTIYATGGEYAESSASITGYGYVGNASITTPTVSARTPSSVSFSWLGSNITKYYYSTNNANWTDNGTSKSAAFSASAGGTVTIYVKGDAAASYAPASNVSASGTAKSGFSGVTGLSGAGASYTTVTFSWTSSNAGSYNYYTSANSTVQNTTNTSVTVSNGGTTGASVTFYIIGITNNPDYDTPSTYEQKSASGTTPDTTPNAFSLTLVNGYSASPSPNTVTPADAYVTGLDPYATVSISWSVLGFSNSSVSAAGSPNVGVSILPGGTIVTASATGAFGIVFYGTTSSTWGGANTLSLTVGTLTNPSAFSITNKTADTTPAPTSLVFTSKTAQSLDTYIKSDEILVTGMTGSYSIPVYTSGVSGGATSSTQVSLYASSVSGVGGTTWQPNVTSSSPYYALTTPDGELYVKIMIPSSTAYSASTSATLYVGTGSASFTVTTEADPAPDTTPNPFSFADLTGLDVGALVSIPGIAYISGMSNRVNVPVSITNGILFYLPVGSGSMDQYSGTSIETNGDGQLVIYISAFAPDTYATTKTVTLTVGGVIGTWKVITKAPPATFTTINVSGSAPAGGFFRYQFDCTISGTYKFAGGVIDPFVDSYMYLYDATEEDMLTSNDDVTQGSDFSSAFTYYCDDGISYNVRIREYNNNACATYLTITKP